MRHKSPLLLLTLFGNLFISSLLLRFFCFILAYFLLVSILLRIARLLVVSSLLRLIWVVGVGVRVGLVVRDRLIVIIVSGLLEVLDAKVDQNYSNQNENVGGANIIKDNLNNLPK